MADGSYPAEHVERLLQCPVCLDRFKRPKLLPCQHTFCLRPCLEGLINRLTRMLRCPECRAEHVVPRGGPAYFPNNLTIIGFLDLPSLPNAERADTDADASCKDAAGHSNNNNNNNNNTGGRSMGQNRSAAVGADRDGAEDRRPRAGSNRCAACHGEGQTAWCTHCQRRVCEACKQAHMDMVRADVSRLLNQVRRALPRLTEHVRHTGHKGAQLQRRCQGLKTEVTDMVDKHVQELRNRERLLHEDVDAFLVSELRGLRNHQENLEVEMASMASFCDSAESSLDRRADLTLTDGDLVELKRQCVEGMHTLRSYEDGSVRPPVPSNMQLSAESQFLSGAIQNFGDLVITPGTNFMMHAVAGSGISSSLTSVQQGTGGAGRRDHTLLDAADLPLALLWSSALSSSTNAPSIGRRGSGHGMPLRVAQSAEDNLADDTVPEEEPSSAAPRARRCRRRDRRPTAATRASEDTSISEQIRSRLCQHHRMRLASQDNPDLSDSFTDDFLERRLARGRRRARAFQPQAENNSAEAAAPQPATTLPSSAARASGRDNDGGMSVDTPEPEESTEPSRIMEDATLYESSPSTYISSPRNKYGSKGRALAVFGERGTGDCQFTWPRGVSASPLDDVIYVSDSSNHRVQVFNSEGTYLRTFGRYGQGEGEFDCLAGITVSSLGHVVIADRYNHRVQVFDRHGTFQRAFGSEGTGDGELRYPWGVACDSMGFIYVCDKENHRVQVFQTNGAFVRKFGRPGKGLGQLDNPHYVAVSPDNRVYVSDNSNHRVQVFSINGNFLFAFGTSGTRRGQMKHPRGIAVDSQGFVLVADSGNNRVQVFRADGQFFCMFGAWGNDHGQFKGLEGLSVLTSGKVVVTDRENHRVQIF